MKLRLSDWANIAEIGSGLAVLVTLVLLFLGILENTQVTRVYNDVVDSINELSKDMYRDPQLSRIWTHSSTRILPLCKKRMRVASMQSFSS